MDAWQAAAIALAIGFVIGAERERDGGPAGVRTFALAGLAGAVAALVHPMVLAAAVAGAALLVAAGYLSPALPAAGTHEEAEADDAPASPKTRLSTASAIALLVTVLLGGLAVTLPALAAAAGVATAVLLLVKERLHTVIRERITELELNDALKFFVAAFIVLPLVPHANLGPGGVIDPRRMWTFVVAVTALGWLGYVAVRLAGPERGLPAAGLAGGFISSAATTGAMARTSRSAEFFRPAMAAALLATVASLVQLVLVTAVADTRVALLLLPAVALSAGVMALEAGWLLWRKGGTAWDRLQRYVPSGGGDAEASDRTGTSRADTDRTGTDATDTVADTATDAVPAEPDVSADDADAADGPVPGEPARPPAVVGRSAVVLEGGTVTKIDFGAPSTAESSTVDESTREMPVVDSQTRELPPVRRHRMPKALVGRRPFDLVPALLLAAILTVFLVVSALVEQTLGPGAAVLAIAVAGLADSHAAALTAGNLSSQATLTPSAAVLAVSLALGVHTVVKLILAQVAGGRRASVTLAALFVGPLVAFVLGLLLSLGLS